MNVNYALALSISAILSAAIALIAWNRRAAPGASGLALFMLSLTVWALTYAIRWISTDQIAEYFWLDATYFGVVTNSLFLTVFTLQFTNRAHLLTRRNLILLSIEPVLTLLLLWTDQGHGLFYGGFRNTGTILNGGPWFWFHVLYSYTLELTMLGLFIQAYRRASYLFRRQVSIILAGVLFPFVGNAISLAGLNPFHDLDLTPILFIVSGLVYAIGLFRYHLMDILPIARDKLVEAMHDGLIVLDVQNRIVDINPAARGMIGISLNGAGKEAEISFASWPELLKLCSATVETLTEIHVSGDAPRDVEARISPLADPGQNLSGRLMILRDITERKHIEAAEREQRALAEALRDSAAALNSTLKFDDVLERILDNVGRVVPQDATNIMLLDADGCTVSIARSRGYLEHGMPDVSALRFDLANMPLLSQVMRSGQALTVADTRANPLWFEQPETRWVASCVIAPIRIRQSMLGFLNVDSATRGFFSSKYAERLQAFADQAAIAIENARLYEEVQAHAITDALTGVFNRRGLFQIGDREVRHSLRFLHPLTILMLDIDHFKRINDTFGHPTGDRVLRALAECCRAQVRNVDVVARYGGEEFVLLLSETNAASGMQVAERLREAVERLVIPAETMDSEQGESVRVTASLGVACLTAETLDLVELFARVDRALYAAKKAGRNRVVFEG